VCVVTASPLIVAIGPRSSWETFETNSARVRASSLGWVTTEV
jgi:hypothetical protein